MGTNKTVTVEHTDDITGEVTENPEVFAFRFDGTNYRIELGPVNAKAFRAAVQPYVDAAKASKATTPGEDVSAVRQWAKDNGHDVKDRGAIPKAVRDAYAAAQVVVETPAAPAAKPAAKAAPKAS